MGTDRKMVNKIIANILYLQQFCNLCKKDSEVCIILLFLYKY